MAMQIDRKLVLHVARLARLELSDAEVAHYETQLGRIVGYMSVLDEVEAAGSVSWKIGPTSTAKGVERPDVVQPSLPIGAVLAGAPEVHESSFKVPKIIE